MKKKWFACVLVGLALALAQFLPVPTQASGDVWRGGIETAPGAGTIQSPYQISKGEHLKWFADQVNKGNTAIYGILTTDIRLNNTSNWENWATDAPPLPWAPIGTEVNKYNGVFDGRGYTISGVYINSTGSYQGLFGYIGMNGAGTVENLKVKESYVKGQSHVGGICGAVNYFGGISGCESAATVVAPGGYAGGITGRVLTNANLSNCLNRGRVEGGDYSGGITGCNNGRVTGCVNLGDVVGSGSSIGGLVGMNYGELTDAYNNGDVSVASGNNVGGICGVHGTNGVVENAYTTGAVADGWPVFGMTRAGSSFTNLFYLGPPDSGGIGSHQGTGEAVKKSAQQFASGEVAYLLGPVYGQTLAGCKDLLPVFRTASNRVYKLTYMNGAVVHAEQFYNEGDVVSAEDIAPPVIEEETFAEWAGLPELMPAEDVTVTASSVFTYYPPEITSESPLPSGAIHQEYSFRIEAVGTKPIAFSIIDGALPPGLALDPVTGELKGTPAESGSFTVTLEATSDYGRNEREFALDILDKMPGTGSMSDPYQVWTVGYLCEFAHIVNTSPGRIYGLLMADISLNNTSGWENWDTTPPVNVWIPMGASSAKCFMGGFNGGGHTIKGVYIDSPGADNIGLFGYVGSATTIKNLNLVESYIRGKEYVGGVCGTLAGLCKLENCSSGARVRGEKYVGGLCGSLIATNASIDNCCNRGQVTGNEWVGGITGDNGGIVSTCSNTGAISGARSGGICGNSSGTVSNVFNTGNVSGGLNTGGICGMMSGLLASPATLTSCHSCGEIYRGSNSAAICGVTNVHCTFTDCYYLEGSAADGIGYNTGDYTTTGMTAAQYSSGETAYLLGDPFGQTLGGDFQPVFLFPEGANRVYRLRYLNEGNLHAAQYYNSGNEVSTAGLEVPQKDNQIFSHWEGLPDYMPAADVTVSAVFTTASVPSPPQDFTAIPGDGQATLSWSAPADTGGEAIQKYEVSLNGGDWKEADSDTGHTCTGLTNGQSYTFKIRAVNAAGAGDAATASATPRTVPGAPQNFIATPADGQVVLTWTVPASNGGAAITSYEVSPDNGDWLEADSATGHTCIGLTNGQSYTFKVRAVNAAGAGDAVIASATPRTVPGEPQDFTATPGNKQVALSWTAPADDGGATIQKYEVSQSDGDWLDADNMTGHTFTGLTNGKSYTFRVRAVNIAGAGDAATASGTPQAPFDPEEPGEYIFQELVDTETGVSIRGTMHRDAVLTVGVFRLHDSSCPACEAIRERMGDKTQNLLFSGDLALSHGFTGELTISLPLGSQYDGKSVTILHCNGGKLETYTAVVADGKATFSVTSLSPFAAFIQTPPEDKPDDIPRTGDRTPWGWWLLLGLSGAAMFALGLKKRLEITRK